MPKHQYSRKPWPETTEKAIDPDWMKQKHLKTINRIRFTIYAVCTEYMRKSTIVCIFIWNLFHCKRSIDIIKTWFLREWRHGIMLLENNRRDLNRNKGMILNNIRKYFSIDQSLLIGYCAYMTSSKRYQNLDGFSFWFELWQRDFEVKRETTNEISYTYKHLPYGTQKYVLFFFFWQWDTCIRSNEPRSTYLFAQRHSENVINPAVEHVVLL